MVHVLETQTSVLNRFIAELRDEAACHDRMRFRTNLERIGQVIAYELSKTLRSETINVTTTLGNADVTVPAEDLVLGTILRAGIPMHYGLLQYFDKAENAIVSAYRKHHDDLTFEISVEYLSSPPLAGKTLIMADPMLATGKSMVLAYEALCARRGKPDQLHLAVAIASEEGLDYCIRHLPKNTHFWIAALDPELNARSYIVPGLGDAGDLAFGPKA
jgi:uracil phosphoribosyltransferase